MSALLFILRNALAFLAACLILAGGVVYVVDGWRGWESAGVVALALALLVRINSAPRVGLRGLPGGLSLSLVARDHRKVKR